MSLRSLIDGHADSVFLNTDHFAESITHYPGGGSGVSVDAIVVREEPERKDQRGEWQYRKLQITVADSVTCLESDRWGVDSLIYETTAVGLADVGLRVIEAQRVQIESQGDVSEGVL